MTLFDKNLNYYMAFINNNLQFIISNYLEYKFPYTSELKYETYNIFDDVNKFHFENNKVKKNNIIVSNSGCKITRRTLPIGNIISWEIRMK